MVFAGVRNDADEQRLRQVHGAIKPVRLDVTDAAQIAAAAETIRRSAVPLRGLVNNAGIALGGPLEFFPLEEFRRHLEVNCVGALAVTQATLPLLRQTHGRIVFMSSVSGQIAPPFLGPYAASKFALEATADALRAELHSAGIAVSVIQPGSVRTPIWRKGRDARENLAAKTPAESAQHYGEAREALLRLTHEEESSGIEPEIVAECVAHALTAPKPRARYAVGSPAGWVRRIFMVLPETLRDRMILSRFSKRAER